MKITTRPIIDVGAKDGPFSANRILRMFELDSLPNAQHPETAAE